MTYTVYKHTCSVSNKSYIGYTKLTVEQRFVNHCSHAKKGSTFQFHKAIAKYGFDCWDSEVLACCESVAEARELEKQFITSLGTFGRGKGYNMTAGGEGNACVGRKLTPEHRAKVVAALRANPPTPAQHKARGLKRRGEIRSEEARAAISAGIAKARPNGPSVAQLAQIKKMHESNKGSKRSAETKAKISAAVSSAKRTTKTIEHILEIKS